MTARLLFLLFLLPACLPKAHAAGTELEAGFSDEQLSGSRPDWRSRYLEAAHATGERNTVYGGLRETNRFALRDTEVSAGYYHPLTGTLTGQVEGSYSGEHNVLPRYSALAQLAWQAGGGWVWSSGWRHSEYTQAKTDLLILGGERYWSSYRAAYTLYVGKPQGTGSASAHRIALNRYYGDSERSFIGIAATAGREVENVGPPLGVASTDVRNVGLVGRHWFTGDWALSYELIAHEQGTLYHRHGFRLGLRHRF